LAFGLSVANGKLVGFFIAALLAREMAGWFSNWSDGSELEPVRAMVMVTSRFKFSQLLPSPNKPHA